MITIEMNRVNNVDRDSITAIEKASEVSRKCVLQIPKVAINPLLTKTEEEIGSSGWDLCATLDCEEDSDIDVEKEAANLFN